MSDITDHTHVDTKLLKKQRLELVEILNTGEYEAENSESYIQGILNFLDWLQDNLDDTGACLVLAEAPDPSLN
jgi:hypothetical protein